MKNGSSDHLEWPSRLFSYGRPFQVRFFVQLWIS